MRNQIKRVMCFVLLVSLCLTSAMPAYAVSDTGQGKSAYGIEMGLINYGVDLNRIYQGSNYAVTLFVGDKSNGGIEFKGSLGENLPNDKLWECIDKALGDEHMTRPQLFETNRMIAKMLQKINQPQESFYEELDMLAEVLDISKPINLLKRIAADTGAGMNGLSAIERQYVKDQLSKQSVSSFTNVKDLLAKQAADKVKEQVKDALKKAGETVSEMAFEGSGKAFGVATGVISKVYEAVALTYKLVDYQNKNYKEVMALKKAAMAKQLQVESFYARANRYVMEYLDNYPMWQLRMNESGTKQFADLEFTNKQGTVIYTIPGAEVTWSAYIQMSKDRADTDPNGSYTGTVKISASYDPNTITSNVMPLADIVMSKGKGSGTAWSLKTNAPPVLRQEWMAENCQIEISGLSGKGGAIILDLPREMKSNVNYNLDYFIICSTDVEGANQAFGKSGADKSALYMVWEVCTPEHAAMPVTDFPAEDFPAWHNFLGLTVPDVSWGRTSLEMSSAGLGSTSDMVKPFFINRPFALWKNSDKGIEISPNK